MINEENDLKEPMNVYFVSLGCDKNLVDSEMMLGILKKRGYQLTDDENLADVIVVNTCGFIRDAQEESVETLLTMAELKASGRCRVLVAAGCLAQRFQEDVLKEIPEIDAVIGTASWQKIADTIDHVLAGQRQACFDDLSLMPVSEADRVMSVCSYSSYLKIAEGCNKRCTYCIIPFLRGPFRSYPVEYLLDQARKLAAGGTKELILVAQETTVYGIDLEGRKMLPELLTALCRIEGIEWIRLLYCYPEEITEELIEVMAREPKICHYLDMPIQHCNDRILKLMGRKTNKEELKGVIARLRKAMPDVALRTTLIAGFPGETEEEHEELLAFIREIRFDRLGVFTYSREEGTKAADMPDQVPEDVKEARQARLMEAQQEIAFAQAEEMTGRLLPVLVDGRLPESGIYVGRTYRDAPDVDGYVYLDADGELISGDIVNVRITDSNAYDLIGDVEYEFTE